jgi:hypothetical protein
MLPGVGCAEAAAAAAAAALAVGGWLAALPVRVPAIEAITTAPPSAVGQPRSEAGHREEAGLWEVWADCVKAQELKRKEPIPSQINAINVSKSVQSLHATASPSDRTRSTSEEGTVAPGPPSQRQEEEAHAQRQIAKASNSFPPPSLLPCTVAAAAGLRVGASVSCEISKERHTRHKGKQHKRKEHK